MPVNSSGGLFVSFEGGEGCGKSTQLKAVAAALHSTGREIITTREPGGSPAAEALRRTLLEDPACRDLNPLATGLLIAAGRHDHLETVVRPALKRGAIVLCDRYIDSTWAYQYGADGLSKENVHSIIDLGTRGLKTNITFIFDLPVAAARARWQARDHGHDRYEGYDDSYHERVRAVFLERARAEPERCRVLDASLPRETLTAQITAEILKWR